MISYHFEWAKSMAIILTVTLELIFRKNADNKMWCGVYLFDHLGDISNVTTT